MDGQGREGVPRVVLERDFTKVKSIGVGGRHGAAFRRALWLQSNAFRGFRGKRYIQGKKGVHVPSIAKNTPPPHRVPTLGRALAHCP
jgi:hypothetical protein